MPIKRVSSMISTSSVIEAKESTAKLPENKLAFKMPSLSNLLVLITIIIFAISVSFRVRDSLEKKFAVSDNQAKTCMIEFSTKDCNPLGMSEQCADIFRCIQKIDNVQLMRKLTSLLQFAYIETKENGFIPAIIIIVILLFQITKSMKAKEETQEKNLVQ